MKSRIRVSSVGDDLFLHSAFPTDDRDSVFLGPDSYRFARFLGGALAGARGGRLVDIGAGAGVGAIAAARLVPEARLTLTDVNPLALRFARINARFAGVPVEILEAATLDTVAGPIDIAIANPPFMIDPAGPAYRDGGGMLGARLALDWTLAAAARLEPGGHMLLYTGSAIVAGKDGLRDRLAAALPGLGCGLDYSEIDPDIFGEELERPEYRDVERIAAVGAIIERIA